MHTPCPTLPNDPRSQELWQRYLEADDAASAVFRTDFKLFKVRLLHTTEVFHSWAAYVRDRRDDETLEKVVAKVRDKKAKRAEGLRQAISGQTVIKKKKKEVKKAQGGTRRVFKDG